MMDADHVDVHTDNSEPSNSHPNEGVTTNTNTIEVATVQQVRDMIEEAYTVQRLETDQRMKELCDHFTSLIKPLQDAIEVLQSSTQGRQVQNETGGSSHSRGKKATCEAFQAISTPTNEDPTNTIKVIRGQELNPHESETMVKKPRLTGTSHRSFPRSFIDHPRGMTHSIFSQPSRALSQHTHDSGPSQYTRPKRGCRRCHKYHKGRCSANNFVCYRCGDVGHLSFSCPNESVSYCVLCGELGHTGMRCPSRQPQYENRGCTAPTTSMMPNITRPTTGVPGRTLQIAADEARDSPNVIAGTITINSTPTLVLIDHDVPIASGSRAFALK